MVKKPFQLVDVVIEDSHQLAGTAAFKEGHLQVLKMVVGLNPQFVLHRLGQVAPEQAVEIFEQGFGAPDQERDNRQQGQLAGHRGVAQLGEPGGLLTGDHIDSQSDQNRWGQVEQLVDNRAKDCQPDRAPMGLEPTQQPAQPTVGGTDSREAHAGVA